METELRAAIAVCCLMTDGISVIFLSPYSCASLVCVLVTGAGFLRAVGRRRGEWVGGGGGSADVH